MSIAPCPCCTIGRKAPEGGRRWLATRLGATVIAASAVARPSRAAGALPPTNLTSDEALALLKEGNAKFRSDTTQGQGQDIRRLGQLAGGQAPFCVIVACADSRVSPELLFDRGFGDLFVVRSAGNTVDILGLGSIEYAVAALRAPLIVVLGHEACGAVAAAAQVVATNATFPGVIGEMIEPIIPAVLAARDAPGNPLDAAIAANARRVAAGLRTRSSILQDALEEGRLRIEAARYDLHDGGVEWFADA